MTLAVLVSPGDELDDCERVIERGMHTFIEVGEALARIRDHNLYIADGFPTFEKYVSGRWGWTRAHAYNLMASAEVGRITGNTPPTIQHGLMLAPLPVEQQRLLAPQIADLTVREAREVVRETVAGWKRIEDIDREPLPANQEPRPADEDEPIDLEHSEWDDLVSVMDAIEALTSSDAAFVAATVPQRRRAATARRLRKLGTYLGRIAWTIEGQGVTE